MFVESVIILSCLHFSIYHTVIAYRNPADDAQVRYFLLHIMFVGYSFHPSLYSHFHFHLFIRLLIDVIELGKHAMLQVCSNLLHCRFVVPVTFSLTFSIVYRFLAAGTVEEKMYEKQVHKDGIKRVVLSGDRSTARYFDQSELADLFKLSPEGECSMLEKFKAKMNNSGAGSSGKPSFLSKHESVIGVASHDVLYSGVAVDVDLTSSNKKSEETPFSRSPFQKVKTTKKTMETIEIEDLTLELDSTHIGNVAKPLGGLNQTRQKREDAKAKRSEAENTLPDPSGSVEVAFSKIDEFTKEQKHAEAMAKLLDLVETQMDSINGDEKLALHKQMAHVAALLGWI